MSTLARHVTCPRCKEHSSYAIDVSTSVQHVSCPFCDVKLEIRELSKDVSEVKIAQ